MCVAVPGKVISLENGIGKVDFMGALREVSFELLDGIKVGDYIMVHAGYAMEKVKEKEAIETLKLFGELMEIGEE